MSLDCSSSTSRTKGSICPVATSSSTSWTSNVDGAGRSFWSRTSCPTSIGSATGPAVIVAGRVVFDGPVAVLSESPGGLESALRAFYRLEGSPS